jgi:hypothetical protein
MPLFGDRHYDVIFFAGRRGRHEVRRLAIDKTQGCHPLKKWAARIAIVPGVPLPVISTLPVQVRGTSATATKFWSSDSETLSTALDSTAMT